MSAKKGQKKRPDESQSIVLRVAGRCELDRVQKSSRSRGVQSNKQITKYIDRKTPIDVSLMRLCVASFSNMNVQVRLGLDKL